MLPVLTVITGLELMGDFGIYGSVINHKKGDQRAFLNTAWTLQILRGFLLWIAACVLAWPIAEWFGFPELLYLIPVAALTTVFAGFQSIEVPLLNRGVLVGRITGLDLVSHIIGVVTMIGLALIYQSVWVLVVGALVGSAIKSGFSHFLVPGFRARLGWDVESFREIYRFGRWIMVSSALTFAAMYADRFLVGRLLDERELGVFSIALYISTALLEVVRRLSRIVLFPIYARLAEQGRAQLRRQTLKVRAGLLGLVVPGLWCMTLFGPALLTLLYDPRYEQAGWMLQYLSIGAVGMVLSLTASGVLLAVRDSFHYMILQIARTLLLIAGMLVGYGFGGFPGLLLGMAIARFAEYPVLAWAINRYNVWLFKLDALTIGASAVVFGLGWYTGFIA